MRSPPRAERTACTKRGRPSARSTGSCRGTDAGGGPVAVNDVRDPIRDLAQPLAGEAVREHEGPLFADRVGVTLHHVQARPHVWGQVDLVDDEKVGVRYA